MSDPKKRKSPEPLRKGRELQDPEELDRRIAEAERYEAEERAKGKWDSQAEEAEDYIADKVEREQERRAQADEAMTKEDREFDNPLFEPGFAAKQNKWWDEEDKQAAKRQKQLDKEAERGRREEQKILERNRKIAEVSPEGEIRMQKFAKLHTTVVGKAVSQFNEANRLIAYNDREYKKVKARETAKPGSWDHTMFKTKAHPKLLEKYGNGIKNNEQKLVDLKKSHPDIEDWVKKFSKWTTEQKLAFAEAMGGTGSGGQDPIVVKGEARAKSEVKEKPDVDMKTEDEDVWDSLEKVHLACYVRDWPLLIFPERVKTKDLYKNYFSWATECGYPKELILPYGPGNNGRTFTSFFNKSKLLDLARSGNPPLWSTKKMKELPPAPDYYLGISTHRQKKKGTQIQAPMRALSGGDLADAIMEDRIDKLDQAEEKKAIDALLDEFPQVPKKKPGEQKSEEKKSPKKEAPKKPEEAPKKPEEKPKAEKPEEKSKKGPPTEPKKDTKMKKKS